MEERVANFSKHLKRQFAQIFKKKKTVKSEKSKYLSNMIYSNSHKPCVLFNTINAVLNTPQSSCLQSFLLFHLFLLCALLSLISLSLYPLHFCKGGYW